jgi:septum site-determining protein MinD
MSRIIGIVSGKGGVGKTTVTVNLSAALIELKKDVIAMDTDLKMSGLALQLGMYYFSLSLNEVLKGEGELFQALYIHSSGLKIIPASLSVENTSIHRLKQVLENLSLQNSIVLIDTPPGLERNAVTILKTCPEILIVTTPEIPAIADALKTASFARNLGTNLLGVIVNMYKKRESNQVHVKEIESVFGLPVVGVVPEDENIKKSIFRGIPGVFFNPLAPSSIAFKKIAANLVGEEYEPPKFLALKRLLRRLRK